MLEKNSGVLLETREVQVGVKQEFRGDQGRIQLFVGNKTVVRPTAVSVPNIQSRRNLMFDFAFVSSGFVTGRRLVGLLVHHGHPERCLASVS